MKTYQLTKKATFSGGEVEGFSLFVIQPDAKREGLYKVTKFNSLDGYKHGFSYLYGKKNQPAIQRMIANPETQEK